MRRIEIEVIFYTFLLSFFSIQCSSNARLKSNKQSSATNMKYNDKKNGGFSRKDFKGQTQGPGLVFIEGGFVVLGRTEENPMYEEVENMRRVTVSSFYMDQTETTNQHWRDYVTWLQRIYGKDYPEIVTAALPDTLAWRRVDEYNEPMVEFYFRHPAYNDYPVVGVSWIQANNYAKWRGDRVNEAILFKKGVLETNAGDPNNPFSTDAYISGQYELHKKGGSDKIIDYNPTNTSGKRRVQVEDGILLPDYRLPTEAEWEYAALGLRDNKLLLPANEHLYPWDGTEVRVPKSNSKKLKKYKKMVGQLYDTFVVGRGNYIGRTGNLLSSSVVTTRVYEGIPNDFGLYHMGGNVSEWVLDVYRPNSFADISEVNPFRGNVFTTKIKEPSGKTADKYDIVVFDLEAVQKFLEKFIRVAKTKKTNQRAAAQEGAEAVATNKNEEALKFSTEQERAIAVLSDGEEKQVRSLLAATAEAKKLLKDAKERESHEVFLNAYNDFRAGEGDAIVKIGNDLAKYVTHIPGEMKIRSVTLEENLDRLNYRYSDYRDVYDGDLESSVYFNKPNADIPDDLAMYQGANNANMTSLVTKKSRVVKGASWQDRAFWAQPGTRRFMDETQSSSTIGFRCAMTKVGSQSAKEAKKK